MNSTVVLINIINRWLEFILEIKYLMYAPIVGTLRCMALPDAWSRPIYTSTIYESSGIFWILDYSKVFQILIIPGSGATPHREDGPLALRRDPLLIVDIVAGRLMCRETAIFKNSLQNRTLLCTVSLHIIVLYYCIRCSIPI